MGSACAGGVRPAACGDAVDEVRRSEQRRLASEPEDAKALKGTRYALLKHPARLRPGEARRLETLRRKNRALDRAYELKEYLATILGQATPEDAPALLDEWLEWAARSRLTPFVKLGRTIRKHAEGILAYLDTKMTNGPVEGINNKLRVIARRAYGFHSPGALISMLFLCCGGIELAATHTHLRRLANIERTDPHETRRRVSRRGADRTQTQVPCSARDLSAGGELRRSGDNT